MDPIPDHVDHRLRHHHTRPTFNPNRRSMESFLPTPTSRLSPFRFICSFLSVFLSVKIMKASGYETDESQVPRRRTSRVTTPVQLGPGMIQPSQDSRRALNSLPSSIAPSNASASNAPSSITHSRKRVRSASRSDNDCEIVGGHIVPNKASKSKKTGSQKTTALMTKGKKNSGSTASQTHKPAPCMNLPQDSDNDNARIRKRTKVSQAEKAGEEEEEEYDDICLYFDAPTHGTDNFYSNTC
ncbi:uncharacterized protein MELLADRAFT_94474 [Melampsora larici-populina 98AG31]|uniref:Uncharacterized protein n=1 Tax=Melampsora larici-populina (strain 98AG31 / pathotype 3-4-7) TaxID=747676 RepID=F4RBJ7_MELLP|nr:uncharacterized protein MELLADRAFT_94474 [Melampsora larici-populina 98AG31]EGG10326.1 hypothetical protein MELLADRAFT_94474 [Melampsora larici-populina 98AG31]